MKKMNLFVFSVFALVLLISSVSALTVSGGDFDLSKDNMTITVTNDGVLNLTNIILTDSGDFDVSFNDSSFGLIVGESKEILVTLLDDKNTFDLSYIYVANVFAEDGLTNASNTITIEPTLCDECSNEGELKITDVNFDVVEGFGDEESYWYLFDEIEVEVEIDNQGSWDIRNVEIEWELYNGDNQKIMDGNEDDFNLDEGDDNTITFTFKLDEDVDEFASEEAILYIRALGEIDDNNANEFDGTDTCVSSSTTVDVVVNDDFMILNNLRLNDEALDGTMLESSVIPCGSEIILTSEVWNIGDNDQEDVYVNVYNRDLEINEDITIGDVDAFENGEFTFSFDLPKDLDEGWYTLEVEIRDEDRDLFENKEDDQSIFNVAFKVEGSCNIQPPQLSAVLDSEAIEGKELLIKTVLTNLESKMITYNIVVDGYSDWAELRDLDQEVVILNEGESQEINIRLDANKDAEGSQSMKISVFSDGELVLEQPLSIYVEKGSFDLIEFLTSNWKLIGLIVLILILVVAIISIVRRR